MVVWIADDKNACVVKRNLMVCKWVEFFARFNDLLMPNILLCTVVFGILIPNNQLLIWSQYITLWMLVCFFLYKIIYLTNHRNKREKGAFVDSKSITNIPCLTSTHPKMVWFAFTCSWISMKESASRLFPDSDYNYVNVTNT